MTTNPYTAPSAELEGLTVVDPEGAEADRRAHIGVERGLKSIGFVYILGGVFSLLGFLSLLFIGVGVLVGGGGAEAVDEVVFFAGLSTFYGVTGGLSIWVGRGLRRRNTAVRIVASVLAVLSLISIPVGTVIGAYLLWLMWSAKGKRVFAEDYQAVIDATPHVVVRTSPVVWVVVGLLVLGISTVVVLGLLGA